jgi:hypothetical protein
LEGCDDDCDKANRKSGAHRESAVAAYLVSLREGLQGGDLTPKQPEKGDAHLEPRYPNAERPFPRRVAWGTHWKLEDAEQSDLEREHEQEHRYYLRGDGVEVSRSGMLRGESASDARPGKNDAQR